MSPEIKKIYEKYMTTRFPGRADIYVKEWEKRFEDGKEWQKSDYNGRAILKGIAPKIYPKNENEFFIREEMKPHIKLHIQLLKCFQSYIDNFVKETEEKEYPVHPMSFKEWFGIVYWPYKDNFDMKEHIKNDNSTIIIIVEGGLIQKILDVPNNIKIIIRNYDTAGMTNEETSSDKDGSKRYTEIEY